MEEIQGWVTTHRAQGHDAHVTVIAAPGTGFGSWCFTCCESGPSTARILTLGDVR